MGVERMKWITRDIVRANPDKAFLFGDNSERRGFGGQAKEMRGEPNAFGIVTKVWPSSEDAAYMCDSQYEMNRDQIDEDIQKVLDSGHQTVVIPSDGLGTGLAQLDKQAPKTFAYLQQRLADLETL